MYENFFKDALSALPKRTDFKPAIPLAPRTL